MLVIFEIVLGLPVQVNRNYKQLSLLNIIISYCATNLDRKNCKGILNFEVV
jgi:hypothetical protein